MNMQRADSPKPFVHSEENHRRAMRAIVDRLIENEFNYWPNRDDGLFIDVVGGYYVGGMYALLDRYYSNDDYTPNSYWTDSEYVDFDDYEDDFFRLNYLSFEHIVVLARISQETVELYRSFDDELDTQKGSGDFDYTPIELVDDPKIAFSWAMRILANNLIGAKFSPTVFRKYPFFPFSLVVEPDEFTLNIRATIRKDKHQLLTTNGETVVSRNKGDANTYGCPNFMSVRHFSNGPWQRKF